MVEFVNSTLFSAISPTSSSLSAAHNNTPSSSLSNPTQPRFLVCIDGMYIIYYTLFKAINKFKRQNSVLYNRLVSKYDESAPNIKINFAQVPEMKNCVNLALSENCRQICKIISHVFGLEWVSNFKYLADVYFTIDDRTSSSFRKDISNEYKANRKVDCVKSPFEINSMIQLILYECDFLDIWNKFGFKRSFIYGAEGDDIIFVLCTRKEKSYVKKIVISADKDLLQIPETFQFDLTGRLLRREFRGGREVSHSDFLLRKILMGDKSDNISPIFKGCGVVTAEKYVQDRSKLKTLFENDNEIKNRFVENAKLIDLSKMPKTLYYTISESIL